MARRVNKRFLTILVAIVVCAVGGIYIAQKLLIHDKPEHYISAAQQADRDQRWGDAAANYAAAARLSAGRQQAELLTSLGTALHHQVMTDPDKFRLEQNAYVQALNVSPDYYPAVAALIDWYQVAVQTSPDANYYRSLIDYAHRAAVLKPDDPSVAQLQYEFTLQQWIAGLQTDDSAVKTAMDELGALRRKNPADARIPFIMAQAMMHQGMEKTRQSPGRKQPPEATDLYAQIVKMFEQVMQGSSKASQDENPSMHFRFAQVLDQLADIDTSDSNIAVSYKQRSWSEIKRARALARPTDADDLAINQYAAAQAIRHGDVELAEQIYATLPRRVELQLELAQMLSRVPGRRDDAEKILASTLQSVGNSNQPIVGIRYRLVGLLTDLRILDYIQEADPGKKTKLGDEIQEYINKMVAAAGSRPPLDLQRRSAQFKILSGNPRDAIADLNRLITADQTAAKDYSIQTLLADAYVRAQLPGKALAITRDLVAQCEQLVPSRPDMEIPVRKSLIQLMLEQGAGDPTDQILALQKLESPQDPSKADTVDPDLVPLELQALLQTDRTDTDQTRALYNKLPQDTERQIEVKSHTAALRGDWTSAIRLQRLLVAKNPNDPQRVLDLVRLLLHPDVHDVQAAHQAARDGLAANPDNTQLKLLVAALEVNDPKVLQTLRENLDKENPDKLEGELDLARVAGEQGNFQDQEKHLRVARELSHDAPRVLDLLFQCYLAQRKFDEAKDLVPYFTESNYDQVGGKLYEFTLARARNDSDAALAIAQQLSHDYPDMLATNIALGDAYQASGNYDSAMTQYSVAIQRQSNNLTAYFGLINCAYKLGKPNDALLYIRQALQKAPTNQTLNQLLISHMLNYGNPVDAYAWFKQQTEQSPAPQVYVGLGVTGMRAAKILKDSGKPDEANAKLAEAIDKLKASIGPKGWPDDGSLYKTLADTEFFAGHPDDAKATLFAWAARPAWAHRVDPYLQLAQLAEHTNHPDDAEAQMRQLLEQSQYNVDLEVLTAEMLATHGKFDDALKLLRDKNPDDPKTRMVALEVLIKQGDQTGNFDQALQQHQSNIAHKVPLSIPLMVMWARALMEHGQYEQAVERTDEVLGKDRADLNKVHLDARKIDAFYCRGRAELRCSPSRSVDALYDLSMVRKMDPNNADIGLDLAGAYLLLNRVDDATKELNAGLVAHPDNKAVRMMLVRIYGSGEHPRYAEAMRLLREVDQNPPFNSDPEIFQAEAIVQIAMNNFDEALDNSSKAESLAPGDPRFVAQHLDLLLRAKRNQDILAEQSALPGKLKNSSWALRDRASAEENLNDPASASADFSAALAAAVAENDALAFERIARTLQEQMGFDAAIAAVQPFSQRFFLARLELAQLQHLKPDDASAVATIDAAMAGWDKLKPSEQLDLIRIASQVYQFAQPRPLVEKARDALDRWLKLQPDNIEAMNNMACLLADDYSPPNTKEGLDYANKAVDQMNALGQHNILILDTQAWLMILSGQVDDGVNILNKVVGEKPFPEAYLHLGEGYLKLQYLHAAQQQAKLGLDMLSKQPDQLQTARIRARLQDLLVRSGQADVNVP